MTVYKALIEMRQAGRLAQLFIDGGVIRLALPAAPYVIRGVPFNLARRITERYRAERKKRKAQR